jgi:hypothetical protein
MIYQLCEEALSDLFTLNWETRSMILYLFSAKLALALTSLKFCPYSMLMLPRYQPPAAGNTCALRKSVNLLNATYDNATVQYR